GVGEAGAGGTAGAGGDRGSGSGSYSSSTESAIGTNSSSTPGGVGVPTGLSLCAPPGGPPAGPGMRNDLWHFPHRAFLPTRSDGAFNFAPQPGHATSTGMAASVRRLRTT